MKPLPDAVREVLNPGQGVLQDRPWWSQITHPTGVVYYRKDGDWAVSPEDAAAQDVANPAIHPGYRAGQVWANDEGRTVQVLEATNTYAVVSENCVWHRYELLGSLMLTRYPFLLSDAVCPDRAPWSPAEER